VVGCEIAVCWQMFKVNSKVISGLFGGPVDASWPVYRGLDKDNVNVGGSVNEV